MMRIPMRNLAFIVCGLCYIVAVMSESTPLPRQTEFPEKCYKHLGCFDTGYPFYDPPNRPISVLPFNKINTWFFFFTPSNPEVVQFINYTSIDLGNLRFDANLTTKIMIHGYSVDFSMNTSYFLSSILNQNGKHNVIYIDWSNSNRPPYAQAVSNARVVAAQLAHFIHSLQKELYYDPKNIHLIGHSLGAHLAGWTGERVPGLGRITGLDPAGPYFYKASPRARLDDADAKFVDAIYTNYGSKYADGLGLDMNVGHLNFYPNGGKVQPGCYNESSINKDFDPIRNSCSHARAIFLFLSTAENACEMRGTICDSYEHLDRCNQTHLHNGTTNLHHKNFRMGMQARKPRIPINDKKLYLRTTAEFPYCV